MISPKSECDDVFSESSKNLVAMETCDIISSLETFELHFLGEPACISCSSPNSFRLRRSLELSLWSVCNDSGSFTHTSTLFSRVHYFHVRSNVSDWESNHVTTSSLVMMFVGNWSFLLEFSRLSSHEYH